MHNTKKQVADYIIANSKGVMKTPRNMAALMLMAIAEESPGDGLAEALGALAEVAYATGQGDLFKTIIRNNGW